MSLRKTAAYSSRITKPKKPPNPFRRSSSSPFSSAPRRKSTQSSASSSKRHLSNAFASAGGADNYDDYDDYDDDDESSLHPSSRLPDTGRPAQLRAPSSLPAHNVAALIGHVRATMFDELPERAAGMSSTRVAATLNFRRSLPPMVPAEHVQALSASATAAERAVAAAVGRGEVRKVAIPGRVGEAGRGRGRAGAAGAVGEGLVDVRDWEAVVRSRAGLPDAVKAAYLAALRAHPHPSVPASALGLPPDAVAALASAGLLTAASAHPSSADLYLRPAGASLGALNAVSTAGATAPSGTLSAVGGSAVFTDAGGSGGQLLGARDAAAAAARRDARAPHLAFALPNTGPYLRLLGEARAHLLQLLARSPFGEAPVGVLRERWDGGVVGEGDAVARAKRARGEWAGVLPGQTRKWRRFHGIRFEWVLEECVGAGLVECFETGSVGMGVRAT
ncbi:serine-threonine protein kinase 19-domain-containing protein [Lineolata rhizophorae]|uniref:Serine-threonine protein kinase 19-domain-containing protein n=1 Tax=Lineolata rhizophorae TaxID=578093 RepID=A0A6A6NSQ5_9PEZI|nr:serine-threonine protein kinase 19-domain-containing protein [Lineolata rhizophorae]